MAEGDEKVRKKEEECKRRIGEAETQEGEREAARILEKDDKEAEMAQRERKVKDKEAEAAQRERGLSRIVVRAGGDAEAIRERARKWARVVEEEWGENEEWYKKNDAWCAGWVEGKAEREEREEERRRRRG